MKTTLITNQLRINPPEIIPDDTPSRGLVSMGDRDPLQNRMSTHPGHGLTPRRLVRVFLEAEAGYPAEQCDLFEDVIENDGHLRSQLETRRDSVAGKEWIVQAGGDTEADWEAATLLEDEMRQLPNFTEMLEHQLTAPWYGWAATEVLWTDEPQNPELVVAPGWFGNWPHRRFVFDDLDDPRAIVTMTDVKGEALEPGRWLFSRRAHRLTARAGLMRTASWWALFKRMNVADWVTFASRFGMPLPIGKYSDDMPKEEKQALREAVAMVGREGFAAFSDRGSIEFAKVDYAGGQEIHPQLAGFCNAEISKLITGATLTSGEGSSTGSYALGAVHENVAFNIVQGDAKRLGDWFQSQIGRPFCLWNGLPGRPPRLKINVIRIQDPTARMGVLVSFVRDLGGTVDADQVRQEFNIKDPVGTPLGGEPEEPPPENEPEPEDDDDLEDDEEESDDDAEAEDDDEDDEGTAPDALAYNPDQPRDEGGKWGEGGYGGGKKAPAKKGVKAKAGPKTKAAKAKEKAAKAKEKIAKAKAKEKAAKAKVREKAKAARVKAREEKAAAREKAKAAREKAKAAREKVRAKREAARAKREEKPTKEKKTTKAKPQKGKDFGDESADKAHAWGTKQGKEWEGKLSTDEKDAITSYTSEAFRSINHAARGFSEATPDVQKTTAHLDAALAKSSMTESVHAYRGAHIPNFKPPPVGGVYSDKGFVSTSLRKATGASFTDSGAEGTVEFKIYVPKGSRAGYVSSVSKLDLGESEILMPRNSRFRIRSVTKNGAGHSIEMELLK